ncbi:MAG: 4-phosphoerythronate dehydrogenase PdxB [Phycisphaerae bacterium]
MKIVADQDIPFVREAFGPLGQVRTAPGRQISPELVRDADVLLVRSVTRVGPDLLANSRVSFVATATIGTDHLDKPFLRQRGIAWADAAGCNANSVAEYVVAALLHLADRRGFSLRGKSLGVIGVGNIGSRVVRYAAALGMNVLQNDPPLQRRTGQAHFVPLQQILQADIITLHVPLTRHGPDATWHMVDAGFLARMKPDAYLINTSRGQVVVGRDLRDALRQRRIAGAVLDVWPGEPQIDPDLLQQVQIGTAHIAGYSLDGKVNGTRMIYQALCRHFGLQPTWDPQPLMPPPPLPRLELRAAGRQPEQIIRAAVKRVYDIEADDAALRGICRLQPEQRGDYFDRLRRDYPIRREFANTNLILINGDAKVSETLRALGFSVTMAQP